MTDEDDRVDESEKPLWRLNSEDRSLLLQIDDFVTGLISRKRDPKTLCEIALTLNFLRRLPRQSNHRCNLTVSYRYEGELQYAEVKGDESSFSLSRGGSADSGYGSDSYSENVFVRFSSGRRSGIDHDVFDWIRHANELLSLGGRLSSENLDFEELSWDDGDSNDYWNLLLRKGE